MIVLKKESKLKEAVLTGQDLLPEINQKIAKILGEIGIAHFHGLTPSSLPGPRRNGEAIYYNFPVLDMSKNIPDWQKHLFSKIVIEASLYIFEKNETWTLSLDYRYEHPGGGSNGYDLGTYFAKENKFIPNR